MNKFKNLQPPRRKYRFDIVGHKKALKSGETVPLIPFTAKCSHNIADKTEYIVNFTEVSQSCSSTILQADMVGCDVRLSPISLITDIKLSPISLIPDIKLSPISLITDIKLSPISLITDIKLSPISLITDIKLSPISLITDIRPAGAQSTFVRLSIIAVAF
jgi:hypothetical protein